ncbi:hypothetical protein H6G11_01780 [Cyanobacterium aponinum FACHB-4101]|uniref:hypothetical protein n=1 Tax=Cyanobacterium aponinum TaxID=379064 RepID=UPI001680064F|nr:hypothetical protein [Cyanobacterium aponinum]MBD2392983.1 hypothetical protein [Cyanobacterium aponinum FACHB-4101]
MSEIKPHENCIEFELDDEISVNNGIIQRIEFSKIQCSLTLRNKGENPVKPNLEILVLNSQGVTIWSQKEVWVFSGMKPGEKDVKTYKFTPSMPSVLKHSIYADNFDETPRWILFEINH